MPVNINEGSLEITRTVPLSINMRLLLGMTVVAYPKNDAMTCMMARERIEPANTVNLGCFIALQILYYLLAKGPGVARGKKKFKTKKF